MSASHPGPVRRFFRALWRFVDVSRRVVLNLVFLAVLIAAVARRGRGDAAVLLLSGVDMHYWMYKSVPPNPVMVLSSPTAGRRMPSNSPFDSLDQTSGRHGSAKPFPAL